MKKIYLQHKSLLISSVNILFGLLLTFSPYSFSKQTASATQTLNISQYKLIGTAKMEKFWLDIYQAEFFTLSGKYQADQYPQLLKITYLRNIKAKNLIKATVEQWQHLGYSEKEIAIWQQELQNLWPNVSKNDQLSFEINNANKGSFYFNGKLLKTITLDEFAQAFINIWLSQNTSEPSLRKQLLGI